MDPGVTLNIDRLAGMIAIACALWTACISMGRTKCLGLSAADVLWPKHKHAAAPVKHKGTDAADSNKDADGDFQPCHTEL
jgi:hypothetical protein